MKISDKIGNEMLILTA